MAKPLIIVESPTKARTIARFLGDGYVVEPSVGHIRDLPRSAKEIPPAVKGQPWSRLGVDVDHDFQPVYVIPAEKREQVKRLRALMKDADELLLATDEDREGESIAWHLVEVLAPKVPTRRMVFHEITEEAIRNALASPRALDRHLVDAQETRRVLDRLYGYEVSPVLWKKVMPRLSAGRVQSPAARLLVERERERMRFRASSYSDLVVTLEGGTPPGIFEARLVRVGARRLAQGRDLLPTGGLGASSKAEGVLLLDHAGASLLEARLTEASFEVARVEAKPYRRSPAAPFVTSTLQQEAGRRLRFSAQRTMSVAQRLYERGFITYMRTDSVALSSEAIAEARRVIAERFGSLALPPSPRVFRSKIKNAQEAHEAIRPAGTRWQSPEELGGVLVGDEARLYELIWRRTLASQMTDALGTSVTVTVRAPLAADLSLADASFPAGTEAELVATGRTITQMGFFLAWRDDTEEASVLPQLAIGEVLEARGCVVEDHTTTPPPRYSEATLVKALEERGIGRPSTYASIISTLLDRGYAFRKGQALVPTFVAFAVVQLMERYFAELVDYDFTAQLEDDLDAIAKGEQEAVPYLREFYFGSEGDGLRDEVLHQLEAIDARLVNAIPIGTAPDGTPVVVRVGRYGPYVQAGEETASVPEGTAPDELTLDRALELIRQGRVKERVLGEFGGQPVVAKVGRFGPYVQLGTDGRSASLFPSMSIETLTLEEAIALLSLPRLVGINPATGEEILAHNGRFGPYLSCGKETRSLDKHEEILTISLEEALARLKEPKRRGTRRASSVELGTDPETGAKVVLRSGRFGPYVSDGKVNATLPRGLQPSDVTLETALDLLGERKARLADDRAD